MTRQEKLKELEAVGVEFKKRNRGEGRHPVWEGFIDGEAFTTAHKMIAECIDEAYLLFGGSK